ncbi:MAG: phage tail tape measure protein, partial [Anaerolineales bacterium]|nr:phage tail tape measure protein [Anaerolineales bacterium]
ATEGLYQYASAGVEAAEAMQMLNHTLTLSMAVQGDHNTLAKLTTQTIMGFNMEFSQAGEVTDKFAHAINKSLIEWDDLASSIKFALPFFISTGQSLDQLLGALAVLTNRALEAGIAGRGLRQALAEFTQHAEDNSAAFHKMGVDILDVDGNMRELTDIAAQFQSKLGDGVKDMDVMMALMEDLNIRGATAFVHLVQNADEFQKQVDDLKNSAGASAEMAEIQQRSLANQIQLVRNALQAPFLMSDKIGEAAGYTNEFSMILHKMVQQFEALIIVEKNGTRVLTEFGQFLKDFAIYAIKELAVMLALVVDTIKSFGDQGEAATRMLHLFTVPLTLAIKLLRLFGPEMLVTLMLYSKLNQILPTNIGLMVSSMQARMADVQATRLQIINQVLRIEDLKKEQIEEITKIGVTQAGTVAIWAQVSAMVAQKAALFGMIYLTQKYGKDSAAASVGIGLAAG